QLDIAGTIIDYIAGKVSFPEIDIRQRLTVSRGYDVAELYIPEGSVYVGQTIDETGLDDKDINVLSLYRGNIVIPNPKPKRVIEARGRRLSVGKVANKKEMAPEKPRRSRLTTTKELPDDAKS